jgi:hypothetical protein
MTRAEPITWLIVAAIIEALRTVRTSAGFYTDFGANVRGDRYKPNEEEGQHCVVIATNLERTAQGNVTTKSTIDLLIECRVPAEIDDAERIAHRALADVAEILSPRQRAIGWPDGASGVSITSERILERPQDMPFVVAQVSARAGLVARPAARE